MNWFWSSFWPNLCSTLVGVILGVPTALWLNAQAGRTANARRETENRERLENGLRAIVAALSYNRERVKSCLATLTNNQALFDVGLDAGAWETSRDEITPVLSNPELHRRIALHFVRLATLNRLSSMYLDMVAGIASALGGVDQTRDALRLYLISISNELLNDSGALEIEIKKILIVPTRN